LTAEITIVGLGPGSSDSLPPVNLDALRNASRLFLRTAVHPVVNWLKQQEISFVSFDKYYDSAGDFDEVYGLIARHVLAAAAEGPVVYAVPGHPLVAETSVEIILRRAEQRDLAVRLLPAMSFLDALYAALRIDPVRGLQVVDGLRLPAGLPDPSTGAVVVQVYDRLVASDVKLALLEVYPAEHRVTVVRAAGVPGEERVACVPLYEIDRLDWVDHLTSLYLPPLREATRSRRRRSLDDLVDIMARLRGENGCPWDREQDHHTLTPYLLEETYEVLEAIQQEDMHKICEELGDLLLQIVFHAQIAREQGVFDIHDVVDGISRKMIRRHPHVFGDLPVKDSGEVLVNWEKIKQEEKKEGGAGKRKSVLDGIPRGLPSLLRAWKIQAKAARVGFDWPDYRGALVKVEEELGEWKEALESGERRKVEQETGDMLFAVINVARLTGVDPEAALTAAVNKFMRRFRHIEEKAALMGTEPAQMSLSEMDSLWELAKKEEK